MLDTLLHQSQNVVEGDEHVWACKGDKLPMVQQSAKGEKIHPGLTEEDPGVKVSSNKTGPEAMGLERTGPLGLVIEQMTGPDWMTGLKMTGLGY